MSELGNNRLSVFGTGGDFRRAYGRDVVPGAPVVAEVCSATCKNGETGFGVGEFVAPYGVAADCRGAVYVDNTSAGRIDKFAEPNTALPPCPPSAATSTNSPPSSVFSFGKATQNRKKGTLSVEVTVPGAGTLAATAGAKIAVTAPQPSAAGVIRVTLKATGKGVKSLKKKGKLKGTLSLTFTPPGGSPNTQSKAVQLVKKLKKPKKDKPRSGPKGGGKAS